MADDLTMLGSDSENNFPPIKKVAMSDSSDSEDEVKVKRGRRTHTVRNRAASFPNPKGCNGSAPAVPTAANLLPLKPSTDFYGGMVNRSLKALRDHKPDDKPLEGAEPDEDVDVEQIFKNRRHGPKNTGKALRQSPRKQARFQVYQSQMLSLDEDDDDVLVTDNSQGEQQTGSVNPLVRKDSEVCWTREPTPPPTPEAMLPHCRKKRLTKKMKEAISELEKFQASHLEDDADGDVSIVEFTSPGNTARETTIMVRSRSGIQRFPMKSNQSFGHIISQMAGHEFVAEERIIMYCNDRSIHHYDTPDSIGLGVADIIDCHIRKPGETAQEDAGHDSDSDDPDIFKLRVQGLDPKSQIRISIRKGEPMEKLMRQYSKQMGIAYGQLTFQFDAEDIMSHDTPDSLELEDGYCIDVIGL